MPSTFPTSNDNVAANKSNSTLKRNDHPAHHNSLADAINAMQSTVTSSPGANKIPLSGSDGKLDNDWLGDIVQAVIDTGGAVVNVAAHGLESGVDCSPLLTTLLNLYDGKKVTYFFPPLAEYANDYRFDSQVEIENGVSDYATFAGLSGSATASGSGTRLHKNFSGNLFKVTAWHVRFTGLDFDCGVISGSEGDALTGAALQLAGTQATYVDHCSFNRIADYAIVFSDDNAPNSRFTSCNFRTGTSTVGTATSKAGIQFPDNQTDLGVLLQNGDYAVNDCAALGGFGLLEIGNTINLNVTGCRFGFTQDLDLGTKSGKVAFVGNRMAVGDINVHGADHTFIGNQISGSGTFKLDTDADRVVVVGNVYSGGKTLSDLNPDSNRMLDKYYALGALTNLSVQSNDPSTPETGMMVMYAKSDGVYVKDSSGTVTGPLGSGSGDGLTEEEADLLYAAISHTHAQSDITGGTVPFQFAPGFPAPVSGDESPELYVHVATTSVAFRAKRTGGSGASVDILKNGVSLLTSAISLTDETWTAGTLVASPDLSVGDVLTVSVSGISGAVTMISTSFEGTR